MKIAASIFIALGMVLNFFVTWWVFGMIGIAFGILMISTIIENMKVTWLGICGIIFTGLLGGILYLCWKPTKA